MKQCSVYAGPARIGPVPDELYGGFVEHLGRNVYGGVYDPGDPSSDENGFRTDVMKCIRDLSMPVTRYPGGCYTDTWRWEDSVGPGEFRPVRLDPQWRQKEPHRFGLDEFIRWCRLVKTEPVITFNLSTRGILEAEELWEYCNFPGGTTLSDRRIRNGAKEPYNIRYWCLGNEIYGSAVGRRSAAEYAVLARETARIIRMHDPEAHLIVCGNPFDPDWNRTVLKECAPFVDFLSLHRMFDDRDGNYLLLPEVFAAEIRRAGALCEDVRRRLGLRHRIRIAVDEWILYDHKRRERPGEAWTVGPHLLEQDYTVTDALLAGALLSMFQNHCDKVALACIAQSVNVIAPIRTEKNGVLWKQSIYDPLRCSSRYGRGEALKCRTRGASAAGLYASSVWNPRRRELVFFLTVRAGTPVRVRLAWEGVPPLGAARAVSLHSCDLTKVNSPGSEELHAERFEDVRTVPGGAEAVLPPFSWTMIRFKQFSKNEVSS